MQPNNFTNAGNLSAMGLARFVSRQAIVDLEIFKVSATCFWERFAHLRNIPILNMHNHLYSDIQ